MDAVVHEFHARFRGEGFEWDPPLPEDVSGGGPGDGEVWSALATMALAAPAGWWLEAAIAGGALWRLERHDASRRTGVRGGVVRLAPLGQSWSPGDEARSLDAEGLASLLDALRDGRHGPLLVTPAVAAAALARDPAVVRLFAAGERPLPELLMVAGDESVPLSGTGASGDAGSRILRLADAPGNPTTTARRLVAWCVDERQAASWPVPPEAEGDLPLRRFLRGPWSQEADELLAQLAQLASAPASTPGATSSPTPSPTPSPIVGWLEVPAAVAMLARCEVVLGACRRKIVTRTVAATRPPALHLSVGEAVLEVPLGVTSFADQAQLIELVHSVADKAIAERLEAEFRQKCLAAPPLSAGWWYLRGVPGDRLAEHAVAAALTLDEMYTLAPPVLERSPRDPLAPAEREQFARGLLARLQSLPPGQHRTTAARFSGLATRLGHAPLNRWIARANPTLSPSPRPEPPKAPETSHGTAPQGQGQREPATTTNVQASQAAQAGGAGPGSHRMGMGMVWALSLLLCLAGGYLVGRLSIPTVEAPDMASPVALSSTSPHDAGAETPSPPPSPALAHEAAPGSALLVELLEPTTAGLERYRPYLSSCNGYGDLELLTSGRLLLVLCGGHGDDAARTSAVCLENRCVELAKLKSKKSLPRLCTRTGAVAEPILHDGKPGYRAASAGAGCHRAPYLLPLTAKSPP